MNNFALEKKDEHKAVLISVDTGEFDAELSIAELMELAETAGVKTEFYVIQKRPTYDSATCIGAGRLKDVAEQAEISGVDLAISTVSLLRTRRKTSKTYSICRLLTEPRSFSIFLLSVP